MEAGDTAFVNLMVSGGAKAVDVLCAGSQRVSWFTGAKAREA